MRTVLYQLAGKLTGASGVSMLATALRVAGGMITLPLALRQLSTPEVGLYYTFLALTSIGLLLDFGFAPSVSRNAAYAMAGAQKFLPHGVPPLSAGSGPNLFLLTSLVMATRRFYLSLAVFLAVALVTFGSWFIADEVQQAGLGTSATWAWVLFGASQAYVLGTSFWHNLLSGIGEVRMAAFLGLISQSAGLLALIVGLLGGAGLFSYGASAILATGISHFLQSRALKKKIAMPRVDPSQQIAVKPILTALWPMAWRQGLVMVGAFLIQRGNTLVSATRLGLDQTASYGLTINLITIILNLSMVPLTVCYPRINQLRVAGDASGIWRIFSQRLYGGLGLAFVGIACIAFAGQDALRLIGSETQILPMGSTLLYGVIYLLEVHHSNYAKLVLSENRNPFVLPSLLSGFAIVALAWWAAGIYGVLGLIVAQGVVQAAWNNWWTVLVGLRGLRQRE